MNFPFAKMRSLCVELLGKDQEVSVGFVIFHRHKSGDAGKAARHIGRSSGRSSELETQIWKQSTCQLYLKT